MFGSALLRREGVRGFRFGIGCLGVIQMIRDGCRQVEIGCIGVGMVMVVTGCQFFWFFWTKLLNTTSTSVVVFLRLR